MQLTLRITAGTRLGVLPLATTPTRLIVPPARTARSDSPRSARSTHLEDVIDPALLGAPAHLAPEFRSLTEIDPFIGSEGESLCELPRIAARDEHAGPRELAEQERERGDSAGADHEQALTGGE